MWFEGSIITAAYFIGAIPTGYLLAKYYGIHDITRYGSGNIGATNVGRLLGIKGFIQVFLFDVLKAFIFLKLLQQNHVEQTTILLSAFALLLGNGLSIFLGFKGGKGVATGIGVIVAIAPLLLVLSFLVWLAGFFWVRTVGVASVIAFISLPLITWYFYAQDQYLFVLMLAISCWGVWRHKDNIKKFLVRVVV